MKTILLFLIISQVGMSDNLDSAIIAEYGSKVASIEGNEFTLTDGRVFSSDVFYNETWNTRIGGETYNHELFPNYSFRKVGWKEIYLPEDAFQAKIVEINKIIAAYPMPPKLSNRTNLSETYSTPIHVAPNPFPFVMACFAIPFLCAAFYSKWRKLHKELKVESGGIEPPTTDFQSAALPSEL